jgi:hypothetical protein
MTAQIALTRLNSRQENQGANPMKIHSLVASRSKALKFAALFGALLGAACGGEAILPESEEIASESEALQASDWVNGWQQVPGLNGTVNLLGTPTACETRFYQTGGGMSLFQKDSSNQIATSSMFRSPFNDWQPICCQTFVSKPACASLDGAHDPNLQNPDFPWSNQFAVLGRTSSNRFQAAIWMLGAPADPDFPEQFGQPPGPGQMVFDWHDIGLETYVSAPAATVHAGKLIVIGLRRLSFPTRNVLVARTHGLNLATTGNPFASGSPWAGPVTLPSLPDATWTLSGDPTIIHAPAANGPATIVTKATKQFLPTRLYRCTTSNGTSFSNWSQIPTQALVNSDPSLELGRDRMNPRITLYYRGVNGQMFQASSNVGSSTFETFTAIPFTDVLVTAPAAIGGVLGTDPSHMVFAKKSGSDALWFAGTNLNVQ